MRRMKLFMGACFGALFILHGSVNAQGAEGIIVPEGYISSESVIRVTHGEDEVKSIQVSINGGTYRDITESGSFHVNGNCDLVVVITYKTKDGREYVSELKKSISNFDGVKPEISAYLKGEVLQIKVSDDLSGVKELCINGKSYTKLKDNGIGINVKELESSNAYITVYAQDNAGNKSSTYKIKNPYYVGEKENGESDQSKNNPQSTEETKPTQATGTLKQEDTKPQEEETQQTPQQQTPPQAEPEEDEESQEDEDTQEVEQEDEETEGNEEEAVTVAPVVPESVVSNNDSGSEEGKEFYTIETKNGKIFYLVVDKNQMSDNVYLLTEVGENDLLNFVNYDGNAVDNGQVELYSIKEEGAAEEVTAEEVVQEKKEEDKKAAKKQSPFGIMAIVLLVGMGAHYIKHKKNGYPEEAGDVDEYELEDEEM